MKDFSDPTAKIRSGEELDLAAVRKYLLGAVPGLSGEISIEQFPAGHSNLTYFIKVGDREMVLRRPPFGSKVKSAHDMGREFTVLSKLHAVYPPAPRPLALCEDDSIIGGKFYLMERIRGVILRRQFPAGLDFPPATARKLGENFIKNLAELHAIDYEAIGLGSLARDPQGYLKRQVHGWADRYSGSKTDEVTEVENVITWLKQNLPPPQGPTIVHNDYKYDNVILDPGNITRIIGVLDWEMSTIGDPLSDLGNTIGYWVQADDPPELKDQAFGPTYQPGNLTRREMVDLYARLTGRDVSHIHFFFSFALFRLAVIIQQIYYRFVKGHTQDERFAPMRDLVILLIRTADEVIRRGQI